MKINRNTARHYFWKEVCDGWFLVDREDLGIIAEKMPPGTSEDMHCHVRSEQFFYMLSGRAVMKTEEEDILLDQGDGLPVPPLMWHQMTNPFEKDAEFLVYSSPNSHGDRMLKEEP